MNGLFAIACKFRSFRMCSSTPFKRMPRLEICFRAYFLPVAGSCCKMTLPKEPCPKTLTHLSAEGSTAYRSCQPVGFRVQTSCSMHSSPAKASKPRLFRTSMSMHRHVRPAAPAFTVTTLHSSPRHMERSPKWSPRRSSRRNFPPLETRALPLATMYHCGVLRTLPSVRMQWPALKVTSRVAFLARSFLSESSRELRTRTSANSAPYFSASALSACLKRHSLKSERLMAYSSTSCSAAARKVAR
mmetsp:Transcript_1103/g.2530  ORF Transcript_1103/g.2530 Transcript_1103/m.2530 type:complete len:244 (-) Transcript_1103:604-1335(-)